MKAELGGGWHGLLADAARYCYVGFAVRWTGIRCCLTAAPDRCLKDTVGKGTDLAAAWEAENTFLATKILVNADAQTCDAVRNALREVVERQGEGRKQADCVQRILGVGRDQAIRIAGNIVGAVLAEAGYRRAIEAGMTHKLWLRSPSPGKTKPGHQEAEARYRPEPCPIKRPFLVNGAALRFPRDFLSGNWDECIDCNCIMIAKRLVKN